MAQDPPSELVRRAMAGDLEAFTELARLWIDRLYVIARLILRDDELAEDATQEALIAAWRDIAGLRDPDRVDSWPAGPRVLSRGAPRSQAPCHRGPGGTDDGTLDGSFVRCR